MKRDINLLIFNAKRFTKPQIKIPGMFARN